MKTSIRAIAMVAILIIGQPISAIAQDDEAAGGADERPIIMQQMHEHMQTMRQQMEKIHASEDPEERKRLMHEHMQSMRSAMTMMGKMSGSMMQSEQMGGPGMNHGHQAQRCKEDTDQCKQMNEMVDRQRHMEQRVSMMQMMMQQMMEREGVEHAQ